MNFATLKESPSLRAQLNAEEGVYVISHDGHMFKVGMATVSKPGQPTRSLYKRMQDFQTCFPLGFKIYNIIVTDTPLQAEKQLHKILVDLKAHRIKHQGLTIQRDSEWFHTDPATIERGIKILAKEPGFYAKRIIRLTSRRFYDLAKPQDAPPTHRSTISCREIKTKRFNDYILELPSGARQAIRAKIAKKC